MASFVFDTTITIALNAKQKDEAGYMSTRPHSLKIILRGIRVFLDEAEHSRPARPTEGGGHPVVCRLTKTQIN